MTVAAELVADLTAAMPVPILTPGSSIGALPAVTVVPADPDVGNGSRYIMWRFDVVVMVARDATTTQLDRLETLTSDTFAALVEHDWHVTGMRFDAGFGDGDVAWTGYVCEVERAGGLVC